jgi:hypothetical protein
MRRSMRMTALAWALLLWACGDEKPKEDVPLPERLTVAQLKDPETCKRCHPKHYDEWAGSMHAYAAVDPVFIAMNQRGQRETNGELGDFCVQCHAPMAVREGMTTDGLNLADLPKWSKGVTCYFCHNAVDVGADHFNANLTLANDDVMRGGIANAVEPGVHGVAKTPFHDRARMESSLLCGTCHDVVNGHGIHLERTLDEHKASSSSIARSGKEGGLSCQTCHMPSTETALVATATHVELTPRPLHEHRWAAVDIALTDDFPGQEAHRRATECALADAARILRVATDRSPGIIDVDIETDAGHRTPSGAAQDRRLWLEITAYDAQGNVLLESGKIEDGALEQPPAGDPRHDPQLCMFRDHLYDAEDHEVHMFWEAEKEPKSRLLPPLTDINTPHSLPCSYRIPGGKRPSRITLRMRMRPIGMDVLNDLVSSGDLAPAFVQKMPTFTLRNTVGVWTAESNAFEQSELSWIRENCVL